MQQKHLLSLLILWFAVISFVAPACDDADDDDSDASEADDDDASPANDDTTASETAFTKISLLLPTDAPEAVSLAAADAFTLLAGIAGLTVTHSTTLVADEDTLNIVIGDAALSASIHTAAELAEMAAESFRLRLIETNGATAIVVTGADARGLQYGVYEVLEILGFRFFHPEQTYAPSLERLAFPETLDVYEAPDWGRRGYHFHTMHPIEAAEFLMKESPRHEQWAKNLINWLVRNKQNYWQFELLREADFDNLIDYYTELLDYSHRRLVDVGVTVTWVFQQQKAWKLLPGQFGGEQREKLKAGIDRLMQVPWDHLNLEMGSTEFTPVEDTLQLAWMNDTTAFLAATYPATEASVKVHCSTGQTAPNYGDINYNYLVQEADPRLGAYPHTVAYFGFGDPALVYGNDNFNDLHAWLLAQIGSRKIYYYPETAYYCSFDIDVPLFLPVYPYVRYRDIALLADKGLDGHITFTSGHEWGYWLNDWVVAKATWDSDRGYRDILGEFAAVFGDAAEGMRRVILGLSQDQYELLVQDNLGGYLAGEDTWDELGYLFGGVTHPKPLTFSELYHSDPEQIIAFQESVLVGLENQKKRYAARLEQIEALRPRVAPDARAWYDELVDGCRVNLYRASHAYHLYAGACWRRLYETDANPANLTKAQAHFTQARAIKPMFLATMRHREPHYRYPFEYSSGWERSVTSYDYRYLYQASTAYWYIRYEKQAIDRDLNPLLMNLIDPLWFMF